MAKCAHIKTERQKRQCLTQKTGGGNININKVCRQCEGCMKAHILMRRKYRVDKTDNRGPLIGSGK